MTKTTYRIEQAELEVAFAAKRSNKVSAADYKVAVKELLEARAELTANPTMNWK